MKKRLTCALLLALLLSVLILPVRAEGGSVSDYKTLAHSLERPEDFDNAEFFDCYWYTDGVGVHENAFTTEDGLTSFEYVYLKAYEGEDKSTAFPAEEARIDIEFEVGKPGVYDFMIEVMAYATDIPRTGLVQINGGEKYYVSSIHGENHETQEFFTGLSAYLTAGDNLLSIYLAPDFDDATVKSLFFDNFYFMLNEDAELPEYQAPPLWSEKKDVVAHQSFDELRKNGDSAAGVFDPGTSASWEAVAAIDSSTERLDYWGWVALKGGFGQFGYQIDNGLTVYDDDFAVEAEEAVLDAAAGVGGTSASRMLIGVDVSELEGEHSVRILYRDEAGNVVTLNEFTVKRTAAAESETVAEETLPETQPETLPDTEPETGAETVADSTADTAAATGAPSTDTTGGDESGCRSVLALSVLGCSIAAAYVLRRRED